MKASYLNYNLIFKKPSGTSRGIMTEKETWFLILENDDKIGIGECGILRGLSYDDRPDYEEKLKWVCNNIHLGEEKLYVALAKYPSIQFGLETAFLSLRSTTPFLLFPSDFTKGTHSIPINGLIWMGDEVSMKLQIEEKLAQKFNCIKLKIGAIDFQKEIDLLRSIRQQFEKKTIEIRVDANGAFEVSNALDKINQLTGFEIHSIEQPIKQNQPDRMAELCRKSPIPIALDEELIGVTHYQNKVELLKKIQPQYIILKPSLIGGFRGAKEWIAIAEELNIGWWITSALESNIGLNAIAQFTYTLNSNLPQGLGTGSLFVNNFDCPLTVMEGHLHYNNLTEWKTYF